MELIEIEENFPFISGVNCKGEEYVGIIQNHDGKIMSFYDFNAIRGADRKKLFLEYGETWWWKSNRQIPINIFMAGHMGEFRDCLRTMAMKDVSVTFGPVTSLNNLMRKRTKKRQIQLIRKSD